MEGSDWVECSDLSVYADFPLCIMDGGGGILDRVLS